MLVGEPKFHSWGRCSVALTNMHTDLKFNSSSGLYIKSFIYTSITTPQDAHTRLVLQVYLGLNTIEFKKFAASY